MVWKFLSNTCVRIHERDVSLRGLSLLLTEKEIPPLLVTSATQFMA